MSHSVLGKTKAVTADHRSAVNDDPLPDDGSRKDGNVGINNRILTDPDRIPHIHSRINSSPVFNLYPVSQTDKRVNGDHFPDSTIFPDMGQGTDTQRVTKWGCKKLGDPGIGQGGIGGY